MNDCCQKSEPPKSSHTSPECHSSAQKQIDWLLWGSLVLVLLFYALHLLLPSFSYQWLHHLTLSVFELVNTMYWGVLIGIIMIGVLGQIPREFVIAILGKGGNTQGIFRATLAGVLLDLCSHGILMVGTKLYERGASLGQVMAFIIASPWNSFTLTIILVSLIGLGWTLCFIALSMLVALVSGIIFDALVKRQTLPGNAATTDLPDDFQFWPAAKNGLKTTRFDLNFFRHTLTSGIRDSGMVLRWLLFGILLASALRAFVPADMFQAFFGPTLIGLSLTIIFSTILEVCSEGSTPIAADILNRAQAPGNGFAFLMGGVSTDYTEIMVLKEATASWKIALFLPLVTLPQIVALAFILNQF